MPSRIQQAIDATLDGVHVTNRDIDRVLSRVRQEEHRKARHRFVLPCPTWRIPSRRLAPILALVVLCLSVLGVTLLRTQAPAQQPIPLSQLTSGDAWISTAQVRSILRRADQDGVEIPAENRKAIEHTLETGDGMWLWDLEYDLALGGFGKPLACWSLRDQLWFVRALQGAGVLAREVAIDRLPTSEELSPSEAQAYACSAVHAVDAGAALEDEKLYRVGCQFLNGTVDGAYPGRYYYLFTFDALDLHGTAYRVTIAASDGTLLDRTSQRGAGRGHTAQEVLAGCKRVYGQNQRRWTQAQLRSYVQELSQADAATLSALDRQFLQNDYPEVAKNAISASRAQTLAAEHLGLKSGDERWRVEATIYLSDTPHALWKVALMDRTSGALLMHYVEVDSVTGSIRHTETVPAEEANQQEFFRHIQQGEGTTSQQVNPQMSVEDAKAAAAQYARTVYQEQADINDPTLYDVVATAYDIPLDGSARYAFDWYQCAYRLTYTAKTPVPGSLFDQYALQNGRYVARQAGVCSYWFYVDWYGNVLDAGLEAQGLIGETMDSARRLASDNRACAVDYDEKTLQALQQVLMRRGTTDPISMLILNTIYTTGDYGEAEQAAMKAIRARTGSTVSAVKMGRLTAMTSDVPLPTITVVGHMDAEALGMVNAEEDLASDYTGAMDIGYAQYRRGSTASAPALVEVEITPVPTAPTAASVYRPSSSHVWKLALETDQGNYLVEVDASTNKVQSVVRVESVYNPWYAAFLFEADMESAGIAPEPFEEPDTEVKRTGMTVADDGLTPGMRVDHIYQRFQQLYGANPLSWSQAQLRAFQQAVSQSCDGATEMGVPCITRTSYPDLPEGGMTLEQAQERVRVFWKMQDPWRFEGGVLIGREDDSCVWKLCYSYVSANGENYTVRFVEVDAMTGAVEDSAYLMNRTATFNPDYHVLDDSGLFWFTGLTLRETIDYVMYTWTSGTNG